MTSKEDYKHYAGNNLRCNLDPVYHDDKLTWGIKLPLQWTTKEDVLGFIEYLKICRPDGRMTDRDRDYQKIGEALVMMWGDRYDNDGPLDEDTSHFVERVVWEATDKRVYDVNKPLDILENRIGARNV